MPVLTLYAITEAGPPPVTPPLYEVVVGDLSAVVEAAGGVAEATPEALWAHEYAVEAVMAHRPVLPVRFGTRFRDADALRALLTARADAFRAALTLVRGHVEVGVRILWEDEENEPSPAESPAEAAPGGPGRQYLLRRLAATSASQSRRTRAETLARTLLDALSPGARDVRPQVLQTPRQLLNVALLVPADAVETVRSRAEAIASQHPHLRVLCTGPWPPYSFTDTA